MPSDQTHQQDLIYWQELQQGSQKALEVLCDTFYPQLFRYGMQLVPDRSLVQDSLQDFFVELYSRHTTLSDIRKVRPYLYVSFRRKLLRIYQKQQRFVPFSGEVSPEAFTISQEQHIILQQLGETRQALLTQAFDQLSHHQKEAVFLRFYEEMDYAEIATVLGLKEVKYARTLVYRSIAALRNAMSGHKASLTLYSTIPWDKLALLFR